MDINLRSSIWQQFGAAIDYLADRINACPDDLWQTPLWQSPDTKPEFAQFWYVAYHTLFWLDLYLYGTEEGFLPPEPFALIEQTEDGPLPEKPYTKDELRTYVAYCRRKCSTTIDSLTDDILQRRHEFPWGEVSYLELLIYNLRHVHGHASQLDMLLGQKIGTQPDYVTQAAQ